ncbi:hypothetical protein [Faecalibacter rhinopitheci]|uniref:Uncharacterized protein n=1 Tax=Faecalibacter rhinopitheci TaxID=2779678 RepID=A0A8J7FY59_9FLAO|nr:hypothetical protein [Faecalibacter rhinopitheci]MBF0597828.1 hypothetical protein [Faecalibacter rhinopitheci]
MNKNLRLILKTTFTFIIVWFISYFVFGEHIGLEFSDYNFAQIFPKILTFATGTSIYFLCLLSINKNRGWNYKNILKFIFGILLAFIPFILFKYYSSVGNCQNWEVTKQVKSTLFVSTSSNSETIKLIEVYCPEMDLKVDKTFRIMSITPLFNTVSEIDTTNISPTNWKKFKQ